MDVFLESKEIYFMVFFVYIFIILRNIAEVKKNTNTTTLPITAIIVIALVIPAIPILIIILCMFALYRQFIKIILKTKHGTTFGGMLSGSDTFHAIGDPSNGISIICAMIQIKKYTSNEFYDIAVRVIERCFRFSKFNSLFLRSFGYPYMLRQKLNTDDCVGKMKIVPNNKDKLSKEELLELLTYYYNTPMPKDGKIPWNILIGTQSVKWRDDGYDYYPIMFKIHHSIADGITLIKLLVGVLADELGCTTETIKPLKNGCINKKNQKSLYTHTYKIFRGIKNFLELFATICYLLYLCPSSSVIFYMYKAKDDNILYNTKMINQKVLGISVEENKVYVEKIKRIKKQFPDVAFPTILLSALSASLDNYYKQMCYPSPPYITAPLPVVSGSSELRNLVPGSLDVKDINLTNTYTVLLMSLPINIDDNHEFEFLAKKPLTKRLQLLNREANILKNSIDYQLNYLVIKIFFAVLPIPILEWLLRSTHCTTAISILAGPPKITYDSGSMVISDLIPWVPHLYNIVISFCAVTYDEKFQIGLSVDKAVIPSEKDAQKILDDIYRYLDVLEKEIFDDS